MGVQSGRILGKCSGVAFANPLLSQFLSFLLRLLTADSCFVGVRFADEPRLRWRASRQISIAPGCQFFLNDPSRSGPAERGRTGSVIQTYGFPSGWKTCSLPVDGAIACSCPI